MGLGIPHKDADGNMHNMIVVKNQIIGIMTKESVLDESFDCICGLAYPTMANTGDNEAKPLFDSIID